MERNLTVCPDCGGRKLEYRNRRHWVCQECGLDLYNNVAAACGIIFYTDDGDILFERRAKDPGKGMLGLAGGFIDPDETVEEACVRECLEETGLSIDPSMLEYVANSPNTYCYKGIEYKTCDLFFAYRTDKKELMGLAAQESEVSEFVLINIKNQEEAEKLPIAFNSSRVALKAFFRGRHF